MQEVERRPAEPNHWATGTGGWGQKTNSESDANWNQEHLTASSNHSVPNNLQPSLHKVENTSEIGGASKSGNVIANSGAADSCNRDKTQNFNKMASVSWGPSSSAVGLDSSLWSGLSSTSSGNTSTWGSSVTPDNQGHKTQIGASCMADGPSSNGSASASSWALSPTSQNGASLPGSLAQSQANNTAGSTSLLLSGSSNNQGMGSLGTSTMPWQNKPFGMRDYSQVSDASANCTSSSSIGSSSSSKEGINSKAVAMTEAGKMDLAAGLANLAIDKTAPPPDVGWKMKTGWNSGGSQPIGGGNPDLDFARAAPKDKKPGVGGLKDGVMSAKEEEIRRAINSNEGWGTRPIRQDTAWDIESITTKNSRKPSVDTSEMTPSTIWNDKGTDIWETSRGNPGAGWVGGATGGGGGAFAEKIPNSWNMPPKPNMDGGDWGGSRSNNPVMSDKTIGTWGGENQQQSSSKLWGGATETGSWNEPPPEHNMAWNGHDTDVGTWEDPAQQSSRRIVSSSGIGPASMGGNGSGMNPSSNMGMGSGNMNMGGSNMGIGNSNVGIGSGAMRMGGGTMGMGGGGGMIGSMNMSMAGSGGNMGMGSGGGMPGNMGLGNTGGMAGNMGMGNPGGMVGNMGMGNHGGMAGNISVGNSGGMAGNMGMGGAANNMSMMVAGMNNMNMTSNSGSGSSGDPSLYWNDPNPKSQGWNPAAGPPYSKTEEPWNKAGMGRTGSSSGWGELANSAQKADDGTSIWHENTQDQGRPGGWGDSSGAWNPAYGARPKTTPWVNGIDQESLQRRLGQQRYSGSGGQPQMRIKLIQHLMDMGFKKEEAQNALISNNMNFENALGELTSGLHGKREMVNDVFQSGNDKISGMMPDNSGIICDDMPENRIDNNPHVPNFPMQNPPFSNTQVPNQSFTSTGMNMYDRSKAGPPMPPNNGGNMNNIQHKLKVLQQQQQGGTSSVFNNLSPTQVRGGAMPGNNTQSMVQQQAAQQQILQQLRLAVQSGLISPQLLNQQLPHNILVMLQQLLQLQNALQNLLQRQQFLQQNKVALNIPRTQLDQVSGMINQYKSQIQALQKQLQAAQQSLLIKQQPPSVPTPSIQQMQSMMQQQPPMGMPPSISAMPGDGGSETMMSFPGDVSISGGTTNTASMSRLNQWKQVSPEQIGQMDLNKAPGSKPQGQQPSHSTPIVGPFGDLPSLNISGDTTWSSSATSGASNWPTTSGNGGSFDGKNEDGTSGSVSIMKESNQLGTGTDVIPEFVPGQPWQGLSSKSVEDDPHITPGSVSRSLSVNVVKDDYLNNLTGNTSKSSSVEASMANAVALGTANLQAQQYGSQWQGGNMDYGRQLPWAGRSSGSAFTQVSGSGWDSRQTPSWMFKNNASQEEAQ